jgi:hypothetical protein
MGENKSAYRAFGGGILEELVVDGRIIDFRMYLNLLKPSGNLRTTGFKIKKILRGAHIAFMCFVRISEQTGTFTL